MSIEPPKPLSDEPPDPDDLLKNDINRSIYRYLKKNPGWHDEITISNRVGTPLLTLRKYLAQLEGHLIEKQGDSLWRLETSIKQQLYKPKQLSLSVESSTSTQLLGDKKFLGYKNGDEQVMENPRKKSHPSIKKRQQGYGGGYVEYKPIKRSGKTYPQYWYHYEFWENGDPAGIRVAARLVKSSKYIPKRLLAKVQKLDAQKAPVVQILELLGIK